MLAGRLDGTAEGDATHALGTAFASKLRAAAGRCSAPAFSLRTAALIGSPGRNHRILGVFDVEGLAGALELELPLSAAARASARELAGVARFALRAVALHAELEGFIGRGVGDPGEARAGSVRLGSFTGEVFAHVCEHYAPADAGLFLHFGPPSGAGAYGQTDDRNFVAAARLRGGKRA